MLAEQEIKTILDGEVISNDSDRITRALIYCRTSGDDSERDSLSAQERTCQEYAQSKGYEVIGTLKESVKGVSGASFNAPELHQALELAKQQRYDVLIIRDVSRFSRDIEKYSFFEPRLRPYVGIEFVWQNFEDTPTGRFYKTMTVGIAQLERDMISQRLTAGKRDKVKNRQSMIVGSREPFGFNVIKKNGRHKPVIVEEEAEIIRMIFRLCVEDEMSTYAIAKELTKLKIPTYADLRGGTPHAKKRKWGEWCMSTVRQYLTNSLYYGEWKYGKIGRKKDIVVLNDGTFKETVRRIQNNPDRLITINVEPIVSKETWDKAQEQLKLNRKNKGRKAKHKYLLAKRITCKCGRIRYTQTFANRYKGKKYEYSYYSCRVQLGGIVNEICDVKRIHASLIDDTVWNWLENILTNRKELNSRIDNYKSEIEKQLQPLKASLNITENELEASKKEYSRILKAWTQADEFDKAFLENDKKVLRAKLETVQSQYDKLRTEVDKLENSLNGVESYSTLITQIQENEAEIMASGVTHSLDTVYRRVKTAHEMRYPSVDYETLEKLWQSETELTFEEKQALIKRFNVTARLSNDGDDTLLTIKCDLGQTFFMVNELAQG